ncbi:MAG TPA: DUF4418 family protein [Lachnospiraceae bacterium]|nr:DUF4418 family protein [Lachnospiraceae bacterium]
MKNRKHFYITCAFLTLIGSIIAIAPFTFAKVCKQIDGMASNCYYTAKGALGIGALLALLGLMAIFVKSEGVRRGLVLAYLLASVLEIVTVTALFPVCDNAQMQCRLVSFPVLLVLGILGAAGSIATVFLERKEHV